MDYSRQKIKQIITETGFIKDNVEKVLRLVDILEELFSSKWRDKLVLKGGTAINMFYMNMPRLSVDIDLDYTGKSRDEMMSDRTEIREYLNAMLSQKNYALAGTSKFPYALDSNVFQYINNAGNRDTIKVEINFLNRAHIYPVQKRKISLFGYENDIGVNVLDARELYGSKFAALIGRGKPRDVYDIYGFIKSENKYDTDELRKCLIFYNCVGGEADILEFSSEKLDSIERREFDRMLKPMLSKSEKFQNNVAIDEIKRYLSVLLQFTDDEREFIKLFRERKYKPELLFGRGEIAVRIGWHPAAFWRCPQEDGTVQEEAMRKAIELENRDE
ncbi:MAG: nucleotidyl transferase AbiEii/AbiGii toxin family protein [Clostridiales bacterium]|nr:nucleotidyl transferase AbiEii/AbiGii toxin family protein [Clostridiales bacterium]